MLGAGSLRLSVMLGAELNLMDWSGVVSIARRIALTNPFSGLGLNIFFTLIFGSSTFFDLSPLSSAGRKLFIAATKNRKSLPAMPLGYLLLGLRRPKEMTPPVD